MKKRLSLFLVVILVFSLAACGSNEKDDPADNVGDLSLYADYDYSSNTIEKGSEYSFGLDAWDMYVATAISDKLVRVVNWDKDSSDKPNFEEEEEIGVFRIDDPETGFVWIDDAHTAFYMNLQDKNKSAIKTGRSVPFTSLVTSSNRNKGANYKESVACYHYEYDSNYSYRAIPLTPTTVKIEAWRCHSGFLFDKILYAYDVLVINTEKTATDFAWTDDEHTSFSITMLDPENGNYWREEKLVYFIIENEDLIHQPTEETSITPTVDTIPPTVDSSEATESNIVTVPMASMECEGLPYTEVVNLFQEAGFTNVTAISSEIEYTDEIENGSVLIVLVNDSPLDVLGQFPADATILIQYAVIKPQETEPTIQIILPDSSSKLGRDLDYKSTSTACYINVDNLSNKPKLQKWGKVTVVDGVADYLDYLINLGYTVEVVDSSAKEPYSGYHAYEACFKVSNKQISWTMDLYIQDEKYTEYQLDIHLD